MIYFSFFSVKDNATLVLKLRPRIKMSQFQIAVEISAVQGHLFMVAETKSSRDRRTQSDCSD